LRHGHEDCPDEAAEFSGNGGDGDVPVLALVKAEEFLGQPVLGLQGNGDDLRRLSLPSAVEDQRSSHAMMVVPGGLDKQSPDMSITGFGDRSAVLPGTGGML
jgi:hypothetical protein